MKNKNRIANFMLFKQIRANYYVLLKSKRKFFFYYFQNDNGKVEKNEGEMNANIKRNIYSDFPNSINTFGSLAFKHTI